MSILKRECLGPCILDLPVQDRTTALEVEAPWSKGVPDLSASLTINSALQLGCTRTEDSLPFSLSEI